MRKQGCIFPVALVHFRKSVVHFSFSWCILEGSLVHRPKSWCILRKPWCKTGWRGAFFGCHHSAKISMPRLLSDPLKEEITQSCKKNHDSDIVNEEEKARFGVVKKGKWKLQKHIGRNLPLEECIDPVEGDEGSEIGCPHIGKTGQAEGHHQSGQISVWGRRKPCCYEPWKKFVKRQEFVLHFNAIFLVFKALFSSRQRKPPKTLV